MTNQIVQTTNNKTIVVGLLKEKKIQFKVKDNRRYAYGSLVVVCDTPLGKGEVEVKVLQFADKKDGTENGFYKGLETVNNEYKTIKEHGENADTIKVEGSLEDGSYYSVNRGEFVDKLEVKGLKINRVEASTPHCCKTDFEGCITKITPANTELEVEIVGVGYNGTGIKVKGMIPEHLVPAFQSRYMVGCTTSLYIATLKTVTVKEAETEVGFGEGFGEVITEYSSKNVIFGGGAVKYAGTAGALTEDAVKQALALKQANDEKKQADAIARGSSSNAGMEQGFGGQAGGQAQAGFGAPANGFGGQAGGFGSMPTGSFGSMPTGSFGGFTQ